MDANLLVDLYAVDAVLRLRMLGDFVGKMEWEHTLFFAVRDAVTNCEMHFGQPLTFLGMESSDHAESAYNALVTRRGWLDPTGSAQLEWAPEGKYAFRPTRALLDAVHDHLAKQGIEIPGWQGAPEPGGLVLHV